MIFCFDLDGTLCTHCDNYEDAEPIESRINYVNELFETGHTIIIDTARGSETGIDWFETTSKQLIKWGCRYHKLRVGQKINADLFIDDKGINDREFFKTISNT